MPIILAILAAIIPVFFWYLIIIRKHRKGMKFFFSIVFIVSACFSFVFTFFETQILEMFKSVIGVFLSFILIGVIIEYGKNFIIRIFGKNYFYDIDDVIDLAFATALGFTFMENILIFYDLFFQPFEYGSPIEITKKILSQEFFILPIHLFCSGIFGYYYGLSLFAKKELKNKKFFRTMQIIKGTLISTVTYGLFFMLKELDPTLLDIATYFGYPNFPINERLLPIISFGFFSTGSLFLFHVIEHSHFLTEETDKKN